MELYTIKDALFYLQELGVPHARQSFYTHIIKNSIFDGIINEARKRIASDLYMANKYLFTEEELDIFVEYMKTKENA